MTSLTEDATWKFPGRFSVEFTLAVAAVLLALILVFRVFTEIGDGSSRQRQPPKPPCECFPNYFIFHFQAFLMLHFKNQTVNTRIQCNKALSALLIGEPKQSCVITLMTPTTEMKVACTIAHLLAWSAWAGFHFPSNRMPTFREMCIEGTDWQVVTGKNRQRFHDVMSQRLHKHRVLIINNFQAMHPLIAKMVAAATECCSSQRRKALVMLIVNVRRGMPKVPVTPANVVDCFVRDHWGQVEWRTKGLLKRMLHSHTVVVTREPIEMVLLSQELLREPNYGFANFF